VDEDALFDAEPLRRVRPKAQRGPKSVAQGCCPLCMKAKIGLLAQGPHVVWRPHYYRTWKNAPVLCSASYVAVCVAPERDPLDHLNPVRCNHP
jgi:hypothetical protein